MATSTSPTTDQCPECTGRIVTDGTEHCTDCGLVVAETVIDHGPEWRSFPDDETDSERAAPGDRTYAGRGMGSVIGYDGEFDTRQRTLNGQAKTRTKRERNEAYTTGEARRIASALDLPDGCGDSAAQLVTDLYAATDSLEGKDLDTVAAAAVLVVARVRQQGLTADDVAAVARGVGTQTLLSRRQWLADVLELSVPLPDLGRRLTVVADELDVSQQTLRSARRVLDGLSEMDTQRGQPSSVAATILWRVADHTQRECADAAGVTTTTIRSLDDKLPVVEQTQLTDY